MMPKINIFVTFDFWALHQWRDAPRKYGYLLNKHRHKFVCSLTISVKHNDRELSFEEVQDWINTDVIPAYSMKDYPFSCEQIGINIATMAWNNFGRKRKYKVVVTEDNFVGAEVFK